MEWQVFTLEKWKLMFTWKPVNIYSRFIHNCQNQDKTPMSFNWCINKSAMIQPYNRILLNNKKKQTTNTCSNIDESPVCHAKRKSYMLKRITTVLLQTYEFVEKAALLTNRSVVVRIWEGWKSWFQYKRVFWSDGIVLYPCFELHYHRYQSYKIIH